MHKIIIVNTSARGDKSTSSCLIEYLLDKLKASINSSSFEFATFNLTSLNNKDTIFKAILSSDTVVFTAPLYVDSLPSKTINFFDELIEYKKSNAKPNDEAKNIDVYSIINCGLLNSHFCEYALNSIEFFCNESQFTWKHGIGIGCGEFLRSTHGKVPLESRMKHDVDIALSSLAQNIINTNSINDKNLFAQIKVSKHAFILMGNMFWRQQFKFKPFKLSAKVHQ